MALSLYWLGAALDVASVASQPSHGQRWQVQGGLALSLHSPPSSPTSELETSVFWENPFSCNASRRFPWHHNTETGRAGPMATTSGVTCVHRRVEAAETRDQVCAVLSLSLGLRKGTGQMTVHFMTAGPE